MKRGLTVIGAGVLLMLAAGCSGDTLRETDALIACKDAIENQLRSPSSADFSGETIEETAAGGYRISGVVDADNAFGASLRSNFSCSISPTGTVSRSSVG